MKISALFKLAVIAGLTGALSFWLFIEFLARLITSLANQEGGGLSGVITAFAIVGALLLLIFAGFVYVSGFVIWQTCSRLGIMQKGDSKILIFAPIILIALGVGALQIHIDPNMFMVGGAYTVVYTVLYCMLHHQDPNAKHL